MYRFEPEFEATLEEMRTFVRRHVVPIEKAVLEDQDIDGNADIQALRAEVRDRAWWAPQLPVDHGGMGLSLLRHGAVSEALGWSPVGHYVFGAQAPDAGNIEILSEFGNDEQQARWLQPLADGRIRSCFGLTEPGMAGSNPTLLAATAVIDEGDWVINAHKWFTSSADGAAFCIVMAVTDPDQPRHSQASMFLVPTDTPGYELVRNIPVMGDVGSGWASHGEIRLTDVRVPADHMLGGRGAGFLIAQQRLGPGRIHHCMRWIGAAERAFDLMCRRAASRDIGNDRPLGTRQTVQNWIAESRAEIDAARWSVLAAAQRIDEEGVHAARTEISTIKFFVAGILNRVLDRAVQTLGALGMTDDTVLAFLYRHERAARIYDGPDEVHKMVVARRILRDDYGMAWRR